MGGGSVGAEPSGEPPRVVAVWVVSRGGGRSGRRRWPSGTVPQVSAVWAVGVSQAGRSRRRPRQSVEGGRRGPAVGAPRGSGSGAEGLAGSGERCRPRALLSGAQRRTKGWRAELTKGCLRGGAGREAGRGGAGQAGGFRRVVTERLGWARLGSARRGAVDRLVGLSVCRSDMPERRLPHEQW